MSANDSYEAGVEWAVKVLREVADDLEAGKLHLEELDTPAVMVGLPKGDAIQYVFTGEKSVTVKYIDLDLREKMYSQIKWVDA